MKAFRIILVGVMLAGYGVTAQAIVQPSTLETYDDGCVVNGSTAGCFSYNNPTSTGFSGPTTTACTAKASNNARCRTCAEAYYDNGQPKGYSVCSYTTRARNVRAATPTRRIVRAPAAARITRPSDPWAPG